MSLGRNVSTKTYKKHMKVRNTIMPKKIVTDKECRFIYQSMYDKGESMSQHARRLNVNRSTVSKAIKKYADHAFHVYEDTQSDISLIMDMDDYNMSYDAAMDLVNRGYRNIYSEKKIAKERKKE